MFFHIRISAKDKQTLKNFSLFMEESKIVSGFLNFAPKYNKRKFVSVLKSPHVNKTAQEQFEYRFYVKEFFVISFKPLTFFLILKKMNDSSLFGIDLRIKNLLKKNIQKRLSAASPDNVRLKIMKNLSGSNNLQKFQASEKYIQLFDCYGEICLKHKFYQNSKI